MHNHSDKSSFNHNHPEKKLLLALFKRAILDYLGPDNLHAREAEGWFFAHPEYTRRQNFSFAWVCDHLGLDLVHATKQLRKLRDNISVHKELRAIRF